MHKIFVLQYVYFMPLHVSSTCAHHREVKIALHSLWCQLSLTFVRFLLLCKTDVCPCAEVVLIVSVDLEEDDPVFYSGVDSVLPSVVVFCYLLSMNELPCSCHILNCRHEYGNTDDTMTLLKQINTPTLLLPDEQMYIQSFHHNNELIPKQHLNEHNPMFDLLHSNTTRHNPPDA